MGIPESFATNSTIPQLVPDLDGHNIISIDVGSEHVIALTNTGGAVSCVCAKWVLGHFITDLFEN